MGKRKVPRSSKKSLERVIAPAMARRDEALDAAADVPTGPVHVVDTAPPPVDVASEMTRPMTADTPMPEAVPMPEAPESEAAPTLVAVPMPEPAPMPEAVPMPDAVPTPVSDSEPATLLAPDEIDRGDAESAAPPPGRAPAGDCRSLQRLRAGAPPLFALIYRHGASLVMRSGTLGKQGEWRVVDYPTPTAASRAYAREVGVFVEDGYVDVR